MIAAIDSYYRHVKAQMAVVDSTQQFGGMVEARDWPQTKPVLGALYLLSVNSQPVGGSWAQTQYEYFLQWVWLLMGDDIVDTQQAANRSKYRAHWQIQSNLRQANVPGFTQKMNYTADPVTGVLSATAVTSTYPLSSIEMVTWNPVRFIPQLNQSAGLIYGVAAVELRAYDDINALLVA